MSRPPRDCRSASPAAPLPRSCAGCHGVVPLAVTTSAGTFYVGWICPQCLVDDVDGVLDVVGTYATREDAEWDLLTEEYYASIKPPDPDPAEAPALSRGALPPRIIRSMNAEQGQADTPPSRRRYARELLPELVPLYKTARGRVAGIAGLVLALGAWAPPVLRIEAWQAWWSPAATGLLVVVGLLDLGYRRYRAVWLEGASVRQELAVFQDANRAAPQLDDNVLEVTLVARALPPVGNRAAGRMLGLRFIDRSLRGVGGCQLRVEQLERKGSDEWVCDPECRTHLLPWERANVAEDIPPGGERTCWIALAYLNIPDDPRGSLGACPTILRGVYRVSLVIESAGYQVRPVQVCFELRTPDPGALPETLLEWRGDLVETIPAVAEMRSETPIR